MLGRRAHAISPTTARNYGVIGDALVELGRYRQASGRSTGSPPCGRASRPTPRVSHARELLGDVPGAIAAMKLALDAAAGQGEAEAWTHVQLGKLYWSVGRGADAGAQYRAALAAFPGYAPALDALALAEWARGRTARRSRSSAGP